MITRRLVVGLFVAACSAFVSAQQAAPTPIDSTARWTVLTDPVCPVSAFYESLAANVTREMRVMYFPAAKGAKLKDPQSLTLNIGFNNPGPRANNTAIPFTRKESYWEVIVPTEKFHAMYAIFSVSDDKGVVDDNGGRFWDVVFCLPTGGKDVNGVRVQAQSHTGTSWSPSLRRPRSYGRAVSVLETFIAQDDPRLSHSHFLLQDLWNYKALHDGGDAPAWEKLAKELDQFVADHQESKDAIYAVGEFVVHNQNKLPSEFVEHTVAAVDTKYNDPRRSFRADLDYNRAMAETNPHKELAALDAFVAKYPESPLMDLVQWDRFVMLHTLADLPGAEAALVKYRELLDKQPRIYNPNAYAAFLEMADMYIERGIKLNEALQLIDQGQAVLIRFQAGDSRAFPQPQMIDAQFAQTRARAYLALHKRKLALEEAQKAVDLRKIADNYFLLAQSFAASGDKKDALEPYFQAAILPSNDDLKYQAELKKFYLKQHFGSEKQFAATLYAHRTDHFRSTGYVPQLVDQAAPASFEFATLAGEKFDTASLNSKTVVVNFWSPG